MMKKCLVWLLLFLLLPFAALAQQPQIELFGEQHAVDAILQKELELWQARYQSGMRHLFVELPYYTAQYLNLWMQAQDDQILGELYDDWAGTAMHSENVLAFYRAIKQDCPQTVFHGTDVGHQYETTGARYLEELEAQGMQDTQDYALAQENIGQGKRYYETGDAVYRENKMVENFIREWEALNTPVMGIYGAAHTKINALIQSGQAENMATQLLARYGELLTSEDLSPLAKDIAPSRKEKVVINGRKYTALYYGRQDISSWLPQYKCRDFWWIKDAYDDFKGMPLNGNVLPESNYPMIVREGEVYMIDYTGADGAVYRQYYRHDGDTWNGMLTTKEFLIP